MSDLKYSTESQRLINAMKEFNKEDFEAWYLRNDFIVGSRSVMAYIMEKEKEKEEQGGSKNG